MPGGTLPLTDDLLAITGAALQQPVFAEISGRLAAQGLTSESCHNLVESVNELRPTHQTIADLKKNLEQQAPELTVDYYLERFLLLNSASQTANDIAALPIAESVKSLYREEFSFFANSNPKYLSMFQVGGYRFAEMCKLVSLRRFPAGQMHWEISGIPRSSLLDVRRWELPKTLNFISQRLGGFSPCFCGHLNGRRKGRLLLLEKAQTISYYRMAKSMERQPEILGYVATSWIHSPATFKVSPHLEWLNSVFLENGGLVVDMGAETPDCGVLVGSSARGMSLEKGEFKPRKAMVIWPRREMIRWAASHPELQDYATNLSTSSQVFQLREA